jgi:hypothetical protein
MVYNAPDGATPPSKATMTITGDKMKISATVVNKLVVDPSNWLVSKTIRVTMDSNSSVVAKDHLVNLRVIPCAVSAITIDKITIEVGN